ncbi:hypothetical protein V6N11_056277 [Hibiscus sabdariffa]|uniref:Uncharacterized protein n=1 Tax=Hibiscus sabdariffa TaxID=183260 RepID=A0ABR2T3A5_9ROSI
MMSIGGTFPEPPFQPPTMSFMHGSLTQTLRKAQDYRNRVMMGLGINYEENFREVWSPLIMDRWSNGAHSDGTTLKRKESLTDLIGGCRPYLTSWRPFSKRSKTGVKSVEHLGLTECKLVDSIAGYTKDMAEEVTGLLENLKFSEEELVDVSNNEEDMLETVEGAEKRGEFQGPFQFGDWLRVDLGKNRLNLRKKPGVVYAGKVLEAKSREWEGERTVGSQGEEEEALETQTGKGKMVSNTSSKLHSTKRSLKGKNEVCHPLGFKKSRTLKIAGGIDDECSEATSPVKLPVPTVEAGC